MNDSKTRLLFISGLVALAVVLPYLLNPQKPNAGKAGGGKNASAKVIAASPVIPQSPPASSADTAARARLESFATIETDEFRAQISNLNGGLRSFVLKAARFAGRGKPVDIVSTDKEAYYPLAIDVDGLPSDADSTWKVSELSPRALLLSRESGGLFVSRKLEAGKGPYQLWLTTHIENRSDQPRNARLRIATYHYVTREAEGGNIPLLPVRSSATSKAVCRHDSELESKDRKALASPLEYSKAIGFAGVENVYFLSAIAPDGSGAEHCELMSSDRGRAGDKPLGSLFSAEVDYQSATLAPGGMQSYRTLAYLGPKSPQELAAAGHSLKGTIESGWFTSLAEGLTWLLRSIHDLVRNWGVAIVLLTLLVKVVLFPLTAKQMQSMARMKELKPELDRLNQLYGDDREKKGAAIMELYRKKGVNPMAGCFPVLLQLPIWFSLYASLSTNIELFRAPFALWWTDLSSPDPYFILPLALGALMFVQQRISPATGTDPVQQKMMLYMMPAMITSFMLFLPAGLCLYMLTNSALSIGQQRLIEARLRAASVGVPASGSSQNPKTSPSEPVAESVITSASPLEQTRAHAKAQRPGKAERRERRGKR